MNWKIKALVQKTTSYMPYSRQVNHFFQKYVTKGLDLNDEYFGDRLSHATEHLDAWKKYGNANQPPSSCLELGAGWHPIVPIALYLAGADYLYSADIAPHTSVKSIMETIEKFIEWEQNGKLREYVDYREDRMKHLHELTENHPNKMDELLESINIKYIVGDARKLGLTDSSVDLVHSNNTFEHIPRDILTGIVADFWRVTRVGGVMSHFVDMSDHFSHFDPSITNYNFLQYSDKQWQRIDNDIQPQNRMRYSDYMAIYESLGIPVTESDLRPGDVEQLRTVDLDESYADYTEEDLAITHCHIISVKG